MTTRKHRLYFTERGKKSLDNFARTEEQRCRRLCRFLQTDLSYYPLQGRLLLNRDTQDKDIEELRRRLALNFKQLELREVYYDDWLVIYSNYKTSVYLLDFISLTKTFNKIIPVWNNSN